MSNKGQAWITDFIISFFIFAIGLILVSRFLFNAGVDNNFNEVRSESELLSEYLFSEGVPSDWDNNSVVRIGLLTDDRLNITKLEMLYNMSYNESKYYLSTPFDYLIYFQQNGTILNISGCGFGPVILNCNQTIVSADHKDLAKISRFVVYNSSIIEMVLYVWK
jgi:hypothetical protein